MAHRINYDEVAQLYDEPLRDHVVDPNLLAFLEAQGPADPSAIRVLDVGCGTGKQLEANRKQFPSTAMVGLDRFGLMLRIAQKRCPNVAWVQADGAVLPFASGSFHYATNQFSYPHIRNTRSFLAELSRILRPGGRFVMTNIDPWAMAGWLVYRYFPEAWELDRQDFLPVDQFSSLMRSAGFEGVHHTHRDLSRPENLRDFQAYASERHRASQFMAISDKAYDAGLGDLARATAAAQGKDILLASEFVVVTITGDKPVV